MKELVIKIPERLWTKQLTVDDYIEIVNAVANGTPLPKMVDSLKELSKDHRHNFVGDSCEERAWRLGIEDSIDLILAESEE